MVRHFAERIKSDFSRVIGTWAELMQKLIESGLTPDEIEFFNNNPEVLQRLVRYWKGGAYEPTRSQKVAHDIMGKNFLGPGEVFHCFKVSF
jgi:hypothetical protein